MTTQRPTGKAGVILLPLLLAALVLLGACRGAAPAPAATSAPAPTAVAAPTPTASAAVAAPAPTRAAPLPTPTPTPIPPPAVLQKPKGIVSLDDWSKYFQGQLQTEKPRYGGTLIIGTFGESSTDDMIQEGGVAGLIPRKPAYDNLIRFSPYNMWQIEPDLAESWTASPDGKRYVFKLRSGVKWHDGRPFTPEDVAFTFNAILKPPAGITSGRKAQIDSALDRAEVSGPNEVTFYMKQTSAAFLGLIATEHFSIVPKHIYDQKGHMKTDIVGTGPFKLKSRQRDIVMRLEKNTGYFKPGLPYLDGVDILMVPDRGTRFAAFRTGRTIMTQTASQALDAEQARVVATQMADVATVVRHGGWVPVTNRYNHTRPPFNDLRVRKALDGAINRQEVIEAMETGNVGAALHPEGPWGIPEEVMLKRPGYRPDKTQDIQEARRLLAEAGYPKGFTMEVIVRAGPRSRGLEIMREQYKAIGVTLNIRVVDTAVGQSQATEALKFDVSSVASGLSMDDPDLALLGGGFVSKSTSSYGFKDALIDQWFEEQTVELDVAKRKAIVLKMQERILELVPHTIVYWDTYHRGWWNQVRGYMPYPGPYINIKNDTIWLAPR